VVNDIVSGSDICCGTNFSVLTLFVANGAASFLQKVTFAFLFEANTVRSGSPSLPRMGQLFLYSQRTIPASLLGPTPGFLLEYSFWCIFAHDLHDEQIARVSESNL